MRAAATIRSTRLPSGLTVVSECLPGLRSVTLGVWLAVGSRDEPDGQEGFAHLLEHTVFKGAGRFSGRQLVERVERCGGEVNAFTTQEETCLWGRVPSSACVQLLEVLAAMAVAPHHVPEQVFAELDVVAAEAAQTDGQARAQQTTLSKLFSGHPLSRPILGRAGRFRAEAGLVEELERFHLRFWRPEATVVVAAGDVDHDMLVDEAFRLFELFGTSSPSPSEPLLQRPVRLSPTFHPAEMSVEAGGSLSHVVVTAQGLPAGHADALALAVCDVLVGSGMASRLFQRLREDRQLVYTTFSNRTVFHDAGLFHLYAACAPPRVGEVAGELTGELQRLELISTVEVERAVAMLRSARLLAEESGPARMRYLGLRSMAGLPLLTTDEDLGFYDRLTVSAVEEQAAKLARSVPLVVVTVD